MSSCSCLAFRVLKHFARNIQQGKNIKLYFKRIKIKSASATIATSFSFLAFPYISLAQSLPDWDTMTAPSELLPVKKSGQIAVKSYLDSSIPETTQSIAKTLPPSKFSIGWNLSSDPVSATLVFGQEGRAALVGFSCRKGDGFVTFRSQPTSSFSANKHVMVTLKSLNGAIRIEAKTNELQPRTIESQVPVRTSSLIFVLTPKKGDVTAKIGGLIEKITSPTTDIKLLRFQSLCDQPLISAADE